MKRSVKKDLLNRLRRIEGQVRGLDRLVGADTYCIDIITQAQAVKQALGAFEDVLLKNHLQTHALMQMKSRKPGRAIDEILSVYRLSRRR